METQTGEGTKAKGRKDAEHQEQVIKLEALSVKKQELISLYLAKEEANTDFSEAVKAVAEEAGLHAKNVRSYIIASAGEKFEKKKEQIGQLSLIFEEVA